MKFEKYIQYIDENSEIFTTLSDDLWDHPELGFQEFYAVERITTILKEQGFQVTENLVGIPTAFKATFGSGSPSMGICWIFWSEPRDPLT